MSIGWMDGWACEYENDKSVLSICANVIYMVRLVDAFNR